MKTSKPQIAVIIQEGRHTQVLAKYPNTTKGKKRAHQRWQKAYTLIQEQLESVPAMVRDIRVDIALV